MYSPHYPQDSSLPALRIATLQQTQMLFSRYLITGGLGSVGSGITEELLSQPKNNFVVVLDDVSSPNAQPLSETVRNSDRFHLVTGNVCNEKLVVQLLKDYQIECVIDCATHSENAIHKSSISGARNAVQGITHVLDAIRSYDPTGNLFKSYVLVSSIKVYGGGLGVEKSPLEPKCFVGAALMGAEAMLHSYVISYRLPLGIVRLGEIFNAENIEKWRSQKETIIVPIALDDAVRGIIAATTKAKDGEVWNIAGPDAVSPTQLIKALDSKESPILTTSKIDTTKASRELSVIPKTVNFTVCSDDVMEGRSTRSAKILIFGAKGWIGQQFVQLLKEKDMMYEEAWTRPGTDKDEMVLEELCRKAPTHVVSMIGRTQGEGCNSITFLEGGPDKLTMNVRDNLYGPWLLASLCDKSGIHFTYLGTGCLFHYNDSHPVGGSGYSEKDIGNYTGTSYSVVKTYTDRLLRQFPNTLQCRIRLPINYEKDNRNLVAKLISFNKVLDMPNSVTVLPDCLPILLDLALKRSSGVINLVNPGAISFCEISEIYQKGYNTEWKFDVVKPDPSNDLVTSRSHCTLDTSLLESSYPIRNAIDGVKQSLQVIAS